MCTLEANSSEKLLIAEESRLIGAAGDRNRNNPSGTGPGIPDSGRPVERYADLQIADAVCSTVYISHCYCSPHLTKATHLSSKPL